MYGLDRCLFDEVLAEILYAQGFFLFSLNVTYQNLNLTHLGLHTRSIISNSLEIKPSGRYNKVGGDQNEYN